MCQYQQSVFAKITFFWKINYRSLNWCSKLAQPTLCKNWQLVIPDSEAGSCYKRGRR